MRAGEAPHSPTSLGVKNTVRWRENQNLVSSSLATASPSVSTISVKNMESVARQIVLSTSDEYAKNIKERQSSHVTKDFN